MRWYTQPGDDVGLHVGFRASGSWPILNAHERSGNGGRQTSNDTAEGFEGEVRTHTGRTPSVREARSQGREEPGMELEALFARSPEFQWWTDQPFQSKASHRKMSDREDVNMVTRKFNEWHELIQYAS